MDTIAHRELRNNSAEVLRRVAAGESLQVTNHGRIAALIVPPPEDTLAALMTAGQVRPARRTTRFADLRRAAGISSAEVFNDLRGDR